MSTTPGKDPKGSVRARNRSPHPMFKASASALEHRTGRESSVRLAELNVDCPTNQHEPPEQKREETPLGGPFSFRFHVSLRATYWPHLFAIKVTKWKAEGRHPQISDFDPQKKSRILEISLPQFGTLHDNDMLDSSRSALFKRHGEKSNRMLFKITC